MLENMLNKLVEKFIEKNLIPASNRELYLYVMEIYAEKIITLSLMMILSVVFHVWLQTILFLIFFFQIRKRTGGYHAPRFLQCFAGTLVIYIVFARGISGVLNSHMQITYILLILAAVFIEAVGAVNHPNVHWNSKEYIASKKIARVMTALEVVIIFTIAWLGIETEYITYMAFGVILSACLLLCGIIFHQEVKENEKAEC